MMYYTTRKPAGMSDQIYEIRHPHCTDVVAEVFERGRISPEGPHFDLVSPDSLDTETFPSLEAAMSRAEYLFARAS